MSANPCIVLWLSFLYVRSHQFTLYSCYQWWFSSSYHPVHTVCLVLWLMLIMCLLFQSLSSIADPSAIGVPVLINQVCTVSFISLLVSLVSYGVSILVIANTLVQSIVYLQYMLCWWIVSIVLSGYRSSVIVYIIYHISYIIFIHHILLYYRSVLIVVVFLLVFDASSWINRECDCWLATQERSALRIHVTCYCQGVLVHLLQLVYAAVSIC